MSYERDLTLHNAETASSTWDGSEILRAFLEESVWLTQTLVSGGWTSDRSQILDITRAMEAIEKLRRDNPHLQHRLVRCIIQTKTEMEVVG